MVSERYKFVEDILDNVLRFNNGELNKQMLCEQMYHKIGEHFRNEISQEIEQFCREDTWDHKLCFCMVCAEIARGEKHD
jgi:hypothetical protein